MKKLIDISQAKQVINLPGNYKLVLFDRLGMAKKYSLEECSRNVYLVDHENSQTWQISSNFDHTGDPFTSINLVNSEVFAYRWDGGSYSVDLTGGFATPHQLAR
jgi:hypothetical protein